MERKLAKLQQEKDDEVKTYIEQLEEMKSDHEKFCQEHQLAYVDLEEKYKKLMNEYRVLKTENLLLKRDLGFDATLTHYFNPKLFSSFTDFISSLESNGIFAVPSEDLSQVIPIGVIKMRHGEDLKELERRFGYVTRLEKWWRKNSDAPLAIFSRVPKCLRLDLEDENVVLQICLASQKISEQQDMAVIRMLGIEIDALVVLPHLKWLKWFSGLPCIYIDLKWAVKTLELDNISMTNYWRDIKIVCKQFQTYVLVAHAKIFNQDHQPPKRGQTDPNLATYIAEGQPGAGLFHLLSTGVMNHAHMSLSDLPSYTQNSDLEGFREKEIPRFSEKLGNMSIWRRRGCARHSDDCKFIMSNNLFHKKSLQDHLEQYVEARTKPDPTTPPIKPMASNGSDVPDLVMNEVDGVLCPSPQKKQNSRHRTKNATNTTPDRKKARVA